MAPGPVSSDAEREYPELSPDWNHLSQYRRYLILPAPLKAEVFEAITTLLCALDTGPYLKVRHSPDGYIPGLSFIPRRGDLERFEFQPDRKIMYVKTGRDPEHDRAMVRVLRVINAQLRRFEHEGALPAYSLGKILCDDCGAHEKHRSRRMITNHWPVADGSPCAPWKGAKYNVTYGADALENL